MKKQRSKPTTIRCAVYTRKSTEEGLEQQFNSLDAQREAAESYIASQQHEGCLCLPERYDDGGFSGGDMQRPALRRLLVDIEAGRIDCVVVYKVDRLSRSLLDFARMMETFERHNVSFVSVTQHFNTTHSMGRLMLNILFSFAQFERETTAERTRDKMAAARRKGHFLGGPPVLGYDLAPGEARLLVNSPEAERVRAIFGLYIEFGSIRQTVRRLQERNWRNKQWITRQGKTRGGGPFSEASLQRLLSNVIYVGQVRYKQEVHAGLQEAIVPPELFKMVQDRLAAQRREAKSKSRCSRALLTGLLQCRGCGRPMGHTFCSRGTRRYRYYVCAGARQRRGACRPLPAVQIEALVVRRIGNLVGERRSADVKAPQEANELPTAADRFASAWEDLDPQQRTDLLQRMVARIEYDDQQGDVSIQFDPRGIQQLAQGFFGDHTEEITP